nr:MAG TPA: Protein of unknown function (DUF2577) [Caudoviricetes sp.]
MKDNNIVVLIQKIIDNFLSSKSFTDLKVGTVKSIDPLQIKLMGSFIVLDESNLILTENVIRKEIRIKPHQHFFEDDHFKHNHGSPLKFPKSVTVEGSITNIPALASPAGPVSGTISSTWQQTKGEVTFDEGKKDLDLSDSGDEIFTKLNRQSTESTLEVVVNGKTIPLSLDPDDEKEEDDKDSPVYWGVLNHGLYPEDKVLLLEVNSGTRWVVLSRMYEGYYYREDKE